VVVEVPLSPVEAAAGFGAGVLSDDPDEPFDPESEDDPPSPDPAAGAAAGVGSLDRDGELPDPDRLSVL
jgi:hypothetical protein